MQLLQTSLISTTISTWHKVYNLTSKDIISCISINSAFAVFHRISSCPWYQSLVLSLHTGALLSVPGIQIAHFFLYCLPISFVQGATVFQALLHGFLHIRLSRRHSTLSEWLEVSFHFIQLFFGPSYGCIWQKYIIKRIFKNEFTTFLAKSAPAVLYSEVPVSLSSPFVFNNCFE